MAKSLRKYHKNLIKYSKKRPSILKWGAPQKWMVFLKCQLLSNGVIIAIIPISLNFSVGAYNFICF